MKPHHQRKLIFVGLAFLVFQLGNICAADAEPVACKTDPRLVGRCFSVQGRLSVRANMRPYIAVFGTGRVIGIASPDGAILMPSELVEVFKNRIDRQAIGTFTICPFSPRRPGVMQFACITDAKQMRVAEDKPARVERDSPSTLRAEIASNGARAVVSRLLNSPADKPGQSWASIEESVALGSDEWLGVAEALAPATDAGASHGLDIALHHALARNPNRVLKLLRRLPERLRFVCADGDDEQTPRAEVRDLHAAITAVAKVTAPQLRAQRDGCLKGLRETLAAAAAPR